MPPCFRLAVTGPVDELPTVPRYPFCRLTGYHEPVERAHKGTILRIVKPLYGIAEAGIHWFATYQTHHKEKLGMETSTFNPCLLITKHDANFGITGLQTRSESDWYYSNTMPNYERLLLVCAGMDTISNTILLRADVRKLWDKMRFGIVPKKNARSEWVLAAHVHAYWPASVHQFYHNRSIHPQAGAAPEFLFARFARDIFPRLHGFLRGGGRFLAVLVVGGEQVQQQYTSDECKSMCVIDEASCSDTDDSSVDPSDESPAEAEPMHAEQEVRSAKRTREDDEMGVDSPLSEPSRGRKSRR